MFGPGRGDVPEGPLKQILLPSGDQFGSIFTWFRFASNSSGWPPLAETRYILDIAQAPQSSSKISVPSGDQRGLKT